MHLVILWKVKVLVKVNGKVMVLGTQIWSPEYLVKIRQAWASNKLFSQVKVKIIVKVKVNVKVMVAVLGTQIRSPENWIRIRHARASQ